MNKQQKSWTYLGWTVEPCKKGDPAGCRWYIAASPDEFSGNVYFDTKKEAHDFIRDILGKVTDEIPSRTCRHCQTQMLVTERAEGHIGILPLSALCQGCGSWFHLGYGGPSDPDSVMR